MRWICVLLVVACSESPVVPDGGDDASAPGCVPACPSGELCVEGACECPPGSVRTPEGCVEPTMCTDETCSGHGVCSEEPLACACELGYGGARCEECADGFVRHLNGECTTSPCDPNPCTDGDRLRCVVVDGAASCACNAGTHEEAGVCVPDTTCMESTCSGRGACMEIDGGVACDCDDGYSGLFCEGCAVGFHPDGMGGCTGDPCTPNPCTAPRERVCTNVAGSAVCACDPGTHREEGACVDDEVCTASICGAGSCAIVDGRVVCTCDRGYEGARCDACAAGFHDDGAGGCTDDACVPSPCTIPNRSACTGGVCACDPGYHDDGVGGCTTDPCVPNPCTALGQACRDNGGTAECYTPTCDDMNPCTDDSVVGGACSYRPRMDGTACSSTLCMRNQVCTGGVCGGGTTVSCDDANPCTRDRCDALTGCVRTNDDTLIPDDGIACTRDRCMGGVQSHTNDDALCSDGLYCNGSERCLPSDPRRNGAGCVAGTAPARPSSTPCDFYGACDEATDSFPRTTLPAGSTCDDGISCTSGDTCRASGLCMGTVLPECPAGAACVTPVSYMPSTVDIGVARIDGAVRVGGAALPSTLPSGNGGGFSLFLVSRETEQRHYIASPQYTNFSTMLTAGTDRVAGLLVPGVYDLVYDRGHYEGGTTSWPYVSQSPDASVFPNGYVVLRRDIVLAPGTQTLDVDVPVTRLSGSIRVNGMPLPATLPSGNGGGFSLFLLSRTTGQRHYVASPQYTNFSTMLTAGTDRVEGLVVPGVYDLIYDRGHYEGGTTSWPYVSQSPDASVFPNGYVVLQGGITLAAGDQVLNVDVPMTRLSGAITVGGAPLPATLPSGNGGGFELFLVSRTTGERHYIASPLYTNFSTMLTAGTDRVEGLVVPGVYDLVYDRGHYEGGTTSWPYVSQSPDASVFPNGYVVLRSGITLAAGDQTLDVDVPVTRLDGYVRVNGAALPATLPSGNGGGFSLFLLSQTTGERHYIASPQYTNFSTELTAGTDRVEGLIVPGTYDLVYDRGHYEGGTTSWPYVSQSPDASVFPNGYVVLREDIVLATGNQTLNVDVPMTRLDGSVRVTGMPLPATLPSGNGGGFSLFLVSQATGQRHYIASPQYTNFSTMLTAGTDRVEGLLVPGLYDLVFDRGHYEGGTTSWPYVSQSPDASIFPNGYVVLREDVLLVAGDQTLNVDVPMTRLDAAITVGGSSLPSTLPSGNGGGFSLFLVSRETAQRHYVASPQYTNFSTMLTPGSDRVEGLLVPGVYDLVFDRGHYEGGTTSWPYVSQSPSASVFPNGYVIVRSCLDLR